MTPPPVATAASQASVTDPTAPASTPPIIGADDVPAAGRHRRLDLDALAFMPTPRIRTAPIALQTAPTALASLTARIALTAPTAPTALTEQAAHNARVLRQAVVDSRAAIISDADRAANWCAAEVATPAAGGADDSGVIRALGLDPGRATGTAEDLLRQLGVRTRPILLAPDWRRVTRTPMIGWTTAGETVALVARRGRRVLRGAGYDVLSGDRAGPVHPSPPLRPIALSLYPAGDNPSQQSAAALLRLALQGSRGDLAQFLVAGVLFGLLALAVPISVATVVPRLLSGGTGQLWSLAALLGAITLLAAAALAVRNATAIRLQGRLQAVLEPVVWDRLLSQDVSFFRRHSTGELVQRANAIAQVRKVLSDVVVGAALNAFFSVVSLAVVLTVAPALGLLLSVAVLLLAAVLVLLARRQSTHEAVVFDTFGEVFGQLYAALLSIDKIQTAGRELQIFARWAQVFRRQKLADAAALRVQARTTAISTALQPLLIAALLTGIVVGALHPSVSQVMVAGVALGQIALAVGQLAQLSASAYGIPPILRRLQPVLAEPEVRGGRQDPGPLTGTVALEAVSFAYPGATEPCLESVTLKAAPGEFVAVVGPSGAGKSTLLRLLIGFERPSAGIVRYGDADLERLDLRALRAQVGTVLQHGTMLRGSIFDNIAGPASQLGEDEVWAAAELAGIAEDLRALPMGLQTRLNETAEGLSGGQVQRLLLARALVRRPSILLLDEATSALDNRTQQGVADRIAGLDCTRVVIAHRLSTVEHADRIYLLDRGRIAGVGNHPELLATNQLYAQLVRRQEATR